MIESYYQQAIKQLPIESLLERFEREDKCWIQSNDILDQWKDVYFYKRNEISLFSKYYIVNKKKIDCSNIQVDVRQKIDDLNRIHQNNKYFFQLGQSVVSNYENKHKYNNFDIALIEYEYITLNEIIQNNNYLMKINLPSTYIFKILESITSYIKLNKRKLSLIDRENQMIHHSDLIDGIGNQINNNLFQLFNKSAPAKLIKNYISTTSFKSSTIIDLNEMFPELIESSRKEVVNSLIALEFPHNIKWVNNLPK